MSYKTLKRLLLWERKQTKVGCQLPTATKMAELEEEEPVPSLLLPCATCGRTFRPEALAKHVKVCEKTLMRKRKQFDSAKQRIQGTDLAQFVQNTKTPKKREPVTRKESLTRWKEKQAESIRSMKLTKLAYEDEGAQISRTPGHEQCSYCERYFGPKAFDRHTEWCKEQQCRVVSKTQACLEAKERLEARTKYRAPLNKTQRTLTKEKYSPVRHTRDPSPLINRTPMSSSLKLSESLKDIGNPTSSPTLTRSSSQRSSFRHTPAAKIPVIAPRGLTRSNSMRYSTSKMDRGSTSSMFEDIGDTAQAKHQATLNNKPKLFGKPNSSEKSDLEKYDPYISAKLQMLDLYSNEGNQNRSNGDSVSSPSSSASSASDTTTTLRMTPLTIRSSPPSAFAKFLPISPEKPSPVFSTSTSISKQNSPISNENNINNNNNNNINNNNNNNNLERKDSPEGEKINNRRNISLSSLSLCSVISLDSTDYNRSPVNWKQSRDYRARSNSALDSSSVLMGRHTARSRLNSYQLSSHSAQNYSPQSTPSPAATVVLDSKAKEDLETCEAELLISMMEFEKMLNISPTHSLQSSPALCSSSFPSDYTDSSATGKEDKVFSSGADEVQSSRRPSTNLQCSDSAYSSLTRKTPVDGLETATLPNKTEFTLPKFCHECGAKYPVAEAKFCCHCGVRRLTI